MADIQSKDLLTAREVCALFRISPATLYRHLNKKGPLKGKGLDLRRIPNQYIGTRRVWSRKACEQLLRGML